MVGCMPTAGCVSKRMENTSSEIVPSGGWVHPICGSRWEAPTSKGTSLWLSSGYPLVILSPHFLPLSVSFCIKKNLMTSADILPCFFFNGLMLSSQESYAWCLISTVINSRWSLMDMDSLGRRWWLSSLDLCHADAFPHPCDRRRRRKYAKHCKTWSTSDGCKPNNKPSPLEVHWVCPYLSWCNRMVLRYQSREIIAAIRHVTSFLDQQDLPTIPPTTGKLIAWRPTRWGI